MPLRPVPIVNALDAVAVTVTDPPRLTEEPLIVIEELVRLELPILLNVLFEPLMVLLVSVSEPANVAKVPVVGSVTLVAPVCVSVKSCAPESVSEPPKVMVLPVLATPVPPLAPISTPASVIAPVVVVPGVNPVVPALKDVTPPVSAKSLQALFA